MRRLRAQAQMATTSTTTVLENGTAVIMARAGATAGAVVATDSNETMVAEAWRGGRSVDLARERRAASQKACCGSWWRQRRPSSL